MHRNLLFTIFIFLGFITQAQDAKTVTGQVTDVDSKFPIQGAVIELVGADPVNFASSDSQGYFKLKNVPVGSINLKISISGYKDVYLNNAMVLAGKELN
jgi:hypothetical protein